MSSPFGMALWLTTRLWALAVCVALAATVEAADESRSSTTLDLLLKARIVLQDGVREPQRVSDGVLVPEGWPPTAPGQIARFERPGAYLVFDLGEVSEIAATSLQADSDDTYTLLGSADGEHFWLVADFPPAPGVGLTERGRRGIQGRARYLRLELTGGAEPWGVAELRVFCADSNPFPPPADRQASIAVSPDSSSYRRGFAYKLVLLALSGALLTAGWRRLAARARPLVAVALIILSAMAWTHFGRFVGAAGVHPPDSVHYFLGSKFAPELGYFELYRCIAEAERQAGWSLEPGYIRNLDDNALRRGSWLQSVGGGCRARFAPERWSAFQRDVQQARPLFGASGFEAFVRDHGYNATPVMTVVLRLFTARSELSAGRLQHLAWLDVAAIALSLGVILWGFGWLVAASFAVFLGCGAVWGYQWIGGSLGRFFFVALLCCGLASIQKSRWNLASVFLALAGLLRLFPLAFLAAWLGWLMVEWRRGRIPSSRARGPFLAAGLTIALGLAWASVSLGSDVHEEFVRKVRVHAVNISSNLLGFPGLLAARPAIAPSALVRDDLTDPFALYAAARRIAIHELAPLRWGLALALALVWLRIAVRGTAALTAVALVGPLLFLVVEMSSYDYVWLCVLLPRACRHRRLLAALWAFIGVTLWSTLWFDFWVAHLIDNLALLALFGYVVLEAWRPLSRIRRRRLAAAASVT